MRRVVRSRPGSALRLSQPLSGFLALPSCVALFRATTVSGIPPSEFFPHRDRAPLSGPLAPLQLSTGVQLRAGPDRSPIVSPTSTLSRGCLVPRSTMDSLSACRGSLSGRPWFWLSGIAPFRQLHLLRSFVPPARPYLETLGCPAAPGRDSPGFCPPKLSPSTPWILDPPRPRGPEHAPSSEDSGARYEGPRPLLPGEIFLSTSTQEDLVDGFQPP
jgi:hypothetical protein